MVSDSKKILYIITQSEFGGAQRYVFDLATRLNADFEILVAAGRNGNGELFARLKERNVKNADLKYLKRPINPWRDILAFFELRQLIKKEKPDIIHLNSSKAGILGSLASRFVKSNTRLAVIYTVHGWVFNEPMNRLKKELYLWLEKWTAKYKNKIICVSEYDRQIAIKNGFQEEKLITIHNGIDFDNLKFLSKEQAREKLFANRSIAQSPNHSVLVGTIANLYPTKGIKHLIEAARIITNHLLSISNLFFVVIGEGQERKKLKALIKKYNLENKFFLAGHIPNASQYLKAFDIFVLPSAKEGLPYVILEAAAAGLPIVATRVGGAPEIIENNRTGLLVEPKNPQELAEKITYLLKNTDIGYKMSETTQASIREKFSLAEMINKTKEVYVL